MLFDAAHGQHAAGHAVPGEAGGRRWSDNEIEQVLSHQDGLSGFPDEMEPSLWFDWDAICAKLAAMEGQSRIAGLGQLNVHAGGLERCARRFEA